MKDVTSQIHRLLAAGTPFEYTGDRIVVTAAAPKDMTPEKVKILVAALPDLNKIVQQKINWDPKFAWNEQTREGGLRSTNPLIPQCGVLKNWLEEATLSTFSQSYNKDKDTYWADISFQFNTKRGSNGWDTVNVWFDFGTKQWTVRWAI